MEIYIILIFTYNFIESRVEIDQTLYFVCSFSTALYSAGQDHLYLMFSKLFIKVLKCGQTNERLESEEN